MKRLDCFPLFQNVLKTKTYIMLRKQVLNDTSSWMGPVRDNMKMKNNFIGKTPFFFFFRRGFIQQVPSIEITGGGGGDAFHFKGSSATHRKGFSRIPDPGVFQGFSKVERPFIRLDLSLKRINFIWPCLFKERITLSSG